ncbi:NAD(P)H-dependent oxidoreductase [Actinocrispum wychmicini]|uniref:FMN reductase n=1 Tax=Actinocrispum wychmicini TaxID=1213861 RepID=A0A4R2JPJ9_9PSEU|nr:NAD(P)H-dependent oxidoreductase [Actinocrispum wychmicini]TCO56095.1 FMN reductase [Actinocrispum wychmicini]
MPLTGAPVSSVVAISASSHAGSATSRVAEFGLDRLAVDGIFVRHIRVRDLPAEALVRADTGDVAVARALASVANADGVIVVTPTHHASYSGLLKVFLDLLPRYALTGKAVLPLVIVGSRAHVLALDYALIPVLNALGARHVVRGYCLVRDQLRLIGDEIALEREAERTLLADLDSFRQTVLALRYQDDHSMVAR